MENTKTKQLEVGDILYSSWGYDQTNIDFYKVKRLAGKTMVELVPIESKLAETLQNSPYQDMVVPYPANEGKPFRRKIQGDYVRLNSYSGASLWDGKPLAQTNSYYGH
jgi:hypothetical protein